MERGPEACDRTLELATLGVDPAEAEQGGGVVRIEGQNAAVVGLRGVEPPEFEQRVAATSPRGMVARVHA